MKATTVKIEGELLSDLEEIKPKNLSLSAFIRLVLFQGIRKQRLRTAGNQYARFLSSNNEEVELLKDWEEADLVAVPRTKKQK